MGMNQVENSFLGTAISALRFLNGDYNGRPIGLGATDFMLLPGANGWRYLALCDGRNGSGPRPDLSRRPVTCYPPEPEKTPSSLTESFEESRWGVGLPANTEQIDMWRKQYQL